MLSTSRLSSKDPLLLLLLLWPSLPPPAFLGEGEEEEESFLGLGGITGRGTALSDCLS